MGELLCNGTRPIPKRHRQGYQRPHKNDSCPPKIKNKSNKIACHKLNSLKFQLCFARFHYENNLSQICFTLGCGI